MQTPDLSDHLSEDIISRFPNADELGMMPSGFFPQENLLLDADDDSEPDDIIILHMDIREALSSLKDLLEEKTGLDLKKYTFWLQDAQILQPHKNLVDQCVKGEGLVQINVQIQTLNQRINIVDVLKPTEAALAALQLSKGNEKRVDDSEDTQTSTFNEYTNSNDYSMDDDSDKERQKQARQKPCLNWVLDSKFRRDQARLKIPEDPSLWTTTQVKHWLQWAVREFNLTLIRLSDWNINGHELCQLTHEEFRQKVPNDPGNVFWTHLELLKKCKYVAVIHRNIEAEQNAGGAAILQRTQKIFKRHISSIIKTPSVSASPGSNNDPNKNGGYNGQVQLWQFLLDILTDREHTNIISWVGGDGEFKLIDPERVAKLWGERKHKPAMNYEKLSRALRYYYDGDMISKVHGKRFAYKFVCNLKFLTGYDAQELSDLVNEPNSSHLESDMEFPTMNTND